MSEEPIEYLKHIRDESFYILSVITPAKTKDDFLGDEALKRAVIRSLEIIGSSPDLPDNSKGNINARKQ